MRTALRVLAAATVAAAVAGCQSGGTVDKTGSATIQLRLASIDDVNDNGQSYGPQAFVDALSQVSGGRIKVQVVTGYHIGDPQAESQLVAAIASGEVDGGWPSTRAFAAAGIAHLRATEAPLTITSYAAEQELVSGPVSARLLSTLKGTGVNGLGLAVGPLRRPFAAKRPLMAVEDWKGARVRSFNSPMQSQTLKSLGAVPVEAGFDWPNQIRDGRLRAAEFDVPQYAANDLGTVTAHVTGNVVLWPKVFVLSLSQKRYDSLTGQQQAWVREAATRAVRASVTGSHDESALATGLCDAGVRFHRASATQLAGLRAAVRPSLDALAADPIDGPLLRDIQAIAANHPAAYDPAPATCTTGAPTSTDTREEVPSTPSALPAGQYRISVSQKDLAEHRLSNNDGLTGIWTLLVRDATYQVNCRPLDLPGTDCGHNTTDKPLDLGDLRGNGHTVYFVFRPERMARVTGCTLPVTADESLQLKGHCGPGGGLSMGWAVNGDQLILTDTRADQGGFSIKPWTRIA
jgi:TRAP-type C4-dicarboxylate transport system substrate-binding protein